MKKRTIGQHLIDSISTWVGSWKFLIMFFIIMAWWVFFNKYDPSPYMLLNSVLGWFAALTTPVLLMASNRQGEIDTSREEKDLSTDMDTNKKVSKILDILTKK